jgi:deoxyribodipyrimidine photo-lyase
VRRWVPELREIEGAGVHEPWTIDPGPTDYPDPIVDHKIERKIALDRYQEIRS